MKIAIDAMGGDNAPEAVVEGCLAAVREDAAPLVLVGVRPTLERELRRLGADPAELELIHADEVVGMDEPATTPLRRKRRSSLTVCAELVRDGRAQAMVTAGNTGAAMAAAMMIVGKIDGVDRPALAAVLPNRHGQTVLLDVGANVETKPAHLRQFAVMGHFFAREVLGRPAPRVGLLSVGEEEGKGTALTREVFKVLQQTGLNFIGNVEGHDVFNGEADVVVCDGFVGNVLLKGSEALASLLAERAGSEMVARLGDTEAVRNTSAALRRHNDFNEYGGAPLLGIRGGCFVTHGRSSAVGVQRTIRGAVEFCSAELHEKIRCQVAVMHEREQELLPKDEGGQV